MGERHPDLLVRGSTGLFVVDVQERFRPHIHGFDEKVSLASIKRITGAMALFVAEWCGLEPA